jgi:cell wall-associated NlpC family hydrolase
MRSIRLLALIGLAALLPCALVQPAHGDTLLDQKRAALARAKLQLHRLDLRVDRLDERYNVAVIRTQQLSRRIGATTDTLHATARRLRADQSQLADLLVAAYKGGLTDNTYALVVGSADVGTALSDYEVRQRLDAAGADVVSRIAEARAAVLATRRELLMERHDAADAAQDLRRARNSIRRTLRRRRRLVRSLGQQIVVATAADQTGQATLALEVRRWIGGDLRGRQRAGESAVADRVALDGLAEIGVPYRWGGASPATGFDCSGLVVWLWANQGVALPHLAAAQYTAGAHVDVSQLEIGDLVFFHHLGHVAIYLGHGYVLHAPHTGDVVRIAPLSTPWFETTYVGATRISR